eukprot:TRINITY_DN3906_c0_g1_i1.p1 TRINITY_DN3906_c0_g1~~TRINITY_DN3906_c0_g1_i1.p1  ORF type:complete len:223 (+),score=-7.67 TRINITY_DN3906_c0_g1_i1:28-669(+)
MHDTITTELDIYVLISTLLVPIQDPYQGYITNYSIIHSRYTFCIQSYPYHHIAHISITPPPQTTHPFYPSPYTHHKLRPHYPNKFCNELVTKNFNKYNPVPKEWQPKSQLKQQLIRLAFLPHTFSHNNPPANLSRQKIFFGNVQIFYFEDTFYEINNQRSAQSINGQFDQKNFCQKFLSMLNPAFFAICFRLLYYISQPLTVIFGRPISLQPA